MGTAVLIILGVGLVVIVGLAIFVDRRDARTRNNAHSDETNASSREHVQAQAAAMAAQASRTTGQGSF